MTTSSKRRHFNELAFRWDQLPAATDPLRGIKQFVERATWRKANRVLDVGCGTGVLLPHLLKACLGAASVVELDFAEEMLRENRRKLSDRRVARICADAAALPFAEAYFDVVLCFGVLPHFADLQSALRGLLRVLRSGGIFSVGHLMGSSELNAFHHSLGEPIAQDTLLPAKLLASTLCRFDTEVLRAEERPDWYFVQVMKKLP